MNSFSLRAVGILARNPEPMWRGTVPGTRFCLTGTDLATCDDETGENRVVTTSLWFSAFGEMAGDILGNSRKGDQLIIEARIRVSETEHEYIVTDFIRGPRQKGRPPKSDPAGEESTTAQDKET